MHDLVFKPVFESQKMKHCSSRRKCTAHLVVADIGQDCISDHGHAGVQQLCALTELDGTKADALLRPAKCPVACTSSRSRIGIIFAFALPSDMFASLIPYTT